MANLEPDAPVSQWSRGFVVGHTWLEEVWSDLLPDELDEELGAILLALTFFHSRRMAEGLREASSDGGKTLETMAQQIHAVFPDALSGYARIGLAIHRALMQHATPHAGRKVGRNEPCPCGSGKKHKRCCGQAH